MLNQDYENSGSRYSTKNIITQLPDHYGIARNQMEGWKLNFRHNYSLRSSEIKVKGQLK